MALFNWFGHKAATPPDSAPDSGGLSGDDPTLPLGARQHGTQRGAPQSNSERKQERLERREALYRVVRDCMTQVGVLSSTYKFKVLSLDSHGRQYLIMIDIPQAQASDPVRFSEIEGLIARSAKARHEILVTAVYWRVSDLVSSAQAASTPTTTVVTASGNAHAIGTASPSTGPAAHTASRATASGKPAPGPSEKAAALDLLFANQNGPVPTDFQDTQVDDHAPELGKTQYGNLN